MRGWQNEKLQELRFIDNDRTMFQETTEWAKVLGFEFCTFAMRVPVPISNPTTFVATNFPESWLKIYQNNDYVNIDPVFQYGMRSEKILVWSDSLFAETPEFWAAAQEAGLRYGLSIPTRDGCGVFGLLSLARNSGEITPNLFEEIKYQLAWLGQIVHQGMSRHLEINSAIGRDLSKRETSVLFWTSEGKTAGEIAEILNIAERTVNFHISNAIAKLNAPNKTAAAVQAAMLGLFR